MIRKLLCWLGWHKYEKAPNGLIWYHHINRYDTKYDFICKHCGKVKI